MAENREFERKDPLPLTTGRPERGPARESSPMEPVLRALAKDVPPEPEGGFAAPSDLRAARQSGHGLPSVAIAAFAVFCLCAAAYGYWRVSDHGGGAPPVAVAAADPTPPADATPTTAAAPLPTQSVDTRPRTMVPGNAAPARKLAVTEQAREKAATARLAAEQALRDKLRADKARADAEDAARSRARAERVRHAADQAQRDKEQAEQARRAAAQAQGEKAQAEKVRLAAAQAQRQQQARTEKARQAAADAAQRQKQLAREKTEQRRLAAARRHQDEQRAARQRKEAARRAHPAPASAEDALEQKLDAQAAGAAPPPSPMRSASLRHQRNAEPAPQSAPGDAPPLDIGDLPPRAPGSGGGEGQ